MSTAQSAQGPGLREFSKPIVFISASSRDYGWRERLKKVAQSSFPDAIDWWDDSRIPAGSRWEQVIGTAIQRSEIAVVLLSPAYLSSRTATSELVTLNTRGLKLFPIVVEECAWQQFDFLRSIQIWSSAKPLSQVPDDLLDQELDRIVGAVVDLTSSDPQPEVLPPPKFNFSITAGSVLRKAQELAARTGRSAVSSSCLLFALAEIDGGPNTATSFLREALNLNGDYKRTFEEFLHEEVRPLPGEALEGWTGSFGRNAIAVITYAQSIAARVFVFEGSREIHSRHLLGALLAPGTTGNPIAERRLTRSRVDLALLSRNFLKFLGDAAPNDNQKEWTVILFPNGIPVSFVSESNAAPSQSAARPTQQAGPKTLANKGSVEGAPKAPIPTTPASPFLAGIPGYTSEFCGVGGSGEVPDHLGVEGLAHRLAELMILRETKLPLAVGLFGNWGSGKSHFMNLMDRHMKALAQTEGPWCREIVPIYFNAWHYSDANLWASLITEVFDALFAHLQPKKDELAVLQDRLQKAGGVTALAAEKVESAREDVRQATDELKRARDDSEDAKATMRSLRDGLLTLLPALDTEDNKRQLKEVLGVSAEDATLSELIAKREELNTINGRVKDLWRRITEPKGRTRRFAWLIGALIALSIACVGVPYLLGSKVLLAIAPSIRALVGVLPVVAAWIVWALKGTQSILSQMERWQKQAETAVRDSPIVEQARTKVSEATARATAAEATLRAAQLEEQRLTQAAGELQPERRLSRFIEARARSADYRSQLGLVSLARRDFQELSNVFADGKPGQDAGLEKLSNSVDRVILYIDDLDRCEPEKVVDVLQAVHLLLAYPLFGVVVGVDQRCLKQSLRIRFKGLLTADDRNDSGRSPTAEDEIPAAPLDYLEKIFHIPFHLPPMTAPGFSTLVEKLTESVVPPKPFAGNVKPRESAAQDVRDATPPPTRVGIPIRAPATLEHANPPRAKPVLEDASVVGSVPLNAWERNALKDYHSLIRTPRGATRLLNTYRLLRAGVTLQEWDSFRGDSGGMAEFRLPMLLLGVAAGQPAVARDWFKVLRNRECVTPLSAEEVAHANLFEWENFGKLYALLSTEMKVPLTNEMVGKWLDRVERYTF